MQKKKGGPHSKLSTYIMYRYYIEITYYKERMSVPVVPVPMNLNIVTVSGNIPWFFHAAYASTVHFVQISLL